MNQTVLAKASYGPYARAMVRICKEENFHKRQGYEIIATLAGGTPAQQAMAQDAVNRWWWPSLMMFGPSDSDSPNSAELHALAGEAEENDELRQRFVDLTVPQAKAVDLTLPDPDLEYDAETEHWEFGAIDWDEFRQVVKGNGPCNRERLAARRNAHDEGAWVREAAAAYAAKQARDRSRRLPDARRLEPPCSRMTADERSRRRRRCRRLAVAAVGSVHAEREGRAARARRERARADAEQALQNARDVYARRGEAREHLGRAERGDHRVDARGHGPVLRSGNDKPYRHPQFYKVPRGVRV